MPKKPRTSSTSTWPPDLIAPQMMHRLTALRLSLQSFWTTLNIAMRLHCARHEVCVKGTFGMSTTPLFRSLRHGANSRSKRCMNSAKHNALDETLTVSRAHSPHPINRFRTRQHLKRPNPLGICGLRKYLMNRVCREGNLRTVILYNR